MQLPATRNHKRQRLFFHELEMAMSVERPAIVLDCTQLPVMDNSAIHLLLCCLEGAMKRNGDVRLAAVAPQGFDNLQRAGAHRLFHFYETVDKAVESYRHRAVHALHMPSPATVQAENAA